MTDQSRSFDGAEPSRFRSLLRRRTSKLVAVAMVAALIAVTAPDAPDAGAWGAPVIQKGSGHVTAEPLPTVQINGVVWDQFINGDTVYAVGQFTAARPAGAAPGVNEVTRNNILAYRLSTGELIATFNASLNAQARVVTMSPDRSRLFVGGAFTNVNGVNRFRIAELDPVTGDLVTGFNAITDATVNALLVTDEAVYAGGAFNFAGSGQVARARLAAFSLSDGDLLTWAPSANRTVQALAPSPDGSRVFAAGHFQTINGASAYGLAAIHAQTGALLSWPIDQVVRNAGPSSAIVALELQNGKIYGSGYHFGPGGNLEGGFSADPYTGELLWVQNCNGDHYDGVSVNGYYYSVGHAHYCGNQGGLTQTPHWATHMRHALSAIDEPAGIAAREPWGYPNWEGRPTNGFVAWYPDWQIGTHTGQSQAGWTIEADEQYVAVGGEFLAVNNISQQGLVRFAVRPIAPGNEGPRLGGNNFPVTARSTAAGQVRVSFNANWDRDDHELTYQIRRNGVTVHERTVASTFWDRPIIGFTDTGLTPGQQVTYQVRTADGDGNTAWSNQVSVTVAGSGNPSAYSDLVMANGARLQWRLGDAAGSTTAQDSLGTQTGQRGSQVSFGAPGAIIGDSDTAANFTNSISSQIHNTARLQGEHTLSVEAWVRTSSNTGGRIVGYSNRLTGTSTNSQFDRVLYMSSDGRINFGARPKIEGEGRVNTSENRVVTSPPGFNNNQWHHVVGTLGPNGLTLYVNGVRVGHRADTMGGMAYYGYWRVGADTLAGWPNRPSTDYLTGQIDEVAIYQNVLTPQQVAAHYAASGRTPAINPAPADEYGAAVHSKDPYLYYRLAEPSGATANDAGIRAHTGDYVGATTRGEAGIVEGNAAVGFDGGAFVAARSSLFSPANYSVETWFNTTTTTGGQLLGFGDSRTATSSQSDRQVYLRDDGRLSFRSGDVTVTSTDAVNDGNWHHVVATQGSDGMKLYVNGAVVALSPSQVSTASFTGHWRVGGDLTPADSTSNGFTGLLDEAAVYDRVLTSAEVLEHLVLGGGQLPNEPPTADFTVGGQFLDLEVDGSGSADPDGSIVSWNWDFGDGATGTGVTAAHTYASPGSYLVTLTVTDDGGAVAQVSQTVVVVAPPVNQPPVASFVVTGDGLGVVVDGSGSSDPDGSVVSWEWDFGDGASGSGETATHVYAAAGIYTVTLTVTDDQGATATATGQVSVSPPGGPQVQVSDAFGRSVSNGFGSADVGGAWSLQGPASAFSVADGQGRIVAPAGAARGAFLGATPVGDSDSRVRFEVDKDPTGGGVFLSSVARKVGNSEYRLRVRVQPSTTQLQIIRVVNGAETTVLAQTVPGVVYTAGTAVNLRFQVTGSGTSQLLGKVWFGDAEEPGDWQISLQDATPQLQGPGALGVHMFVAGSTTNGPVVMSVDDVVAVEALG